MSLTKRLILALATLAGLAPAFAQSPPPVPALPDTERRTSYSISASTCACSVGFQLYGDSTDIANWVQVWLNGVQVAASDPSFGWSLSTVTAGGLANAPRPITNAVLTFVLPQTGTVQIVGARRPRRTSQFQESQPVPTRNINQLNTDIIAMEREIWDLRSRLIQGLPSETMNPLPSASARANNYLVFDTNGNPITAPGVTLIQYIASVNYATTAVLANSPVYANGASGVGATLTETGNGALSVDGNAPIVGNRVLVLNQASTFQNGIYIVTAAGSAGAPYVLTRTTDFNQTTEMFQGVSTLVTGGAANIGTGWTLSASVATIGTSAVTFYETSLSAPNAAANLSFAQDFVAGVGFTAGVTTSLVTTSTPLNANSTEILFDGITQSHNTWSLAGSTFTFLAAIPTNVQVVEIQYLSPTYFTNGVQTIGGVSGPILLGTNLSITGQTVNANFTAQTSVDNILPNVQWQIWSNNSFIVKQNSSGTGNQSNITCTGFATSNANPLFNCVNTQAARVGDLVINTSNGNFWGFSGAGYINCGQVACVSAQTTAARIGAVVANTSITVNSPGFNGVSPVGSAAAVLEVIAPGNQGNGLTTDGWTKTASMLATVDDWGAAALPASTAYPGCIRPLLLRKGITGPETFTWTASAHKLKSYAGQTITFGAAVYHRVQGGAGTWNLHIDDNTGATASPNGTGASLGGYQFQSVTRTVAQAATSLTIYINTTGNAGDVFDVCLPTAFFGPSMVASQLHQNSHELISAGNHWNPPLLTPLIITFPVTDICGGGCGLFGWNGIDLEAISFGTVHNSIDNVYAKVEWTTTTVGAGIFTGPNVGPTHLTFALQAQTQASGQPDVGAGRWPLFHDGTITIYSGVSGLVPSSGTFDFWDVEISPGNSLN